MVGLSPRIILLGLLSLNGQAWDSRYRTVKPLHVGTILKVLRSQEKQQI